MRGESFRPQEMLSEKEKLKKVQAELNMATSVAEDKEEAEFAQGTNPGFKTDQPDISGILEGLDKAAQMSAAEKSEEMEWNQAIKAAKDKIAAAESTAQTAAPAKGSGVDLRGKIKETLQADEEARKTAEEQRWLDKEEAAKRKLSMEAHKQTQSEEAEWNAAIAKAKKRDENQSAIGRLMKRLGFGKNK